MFGVKKLLILLLNVWYSVGAEDDVVTTEDFSTLMMPFEKTDIRQKDVDDALILEVGVYTTMKFNYINAQYLKFDDEFNAEWNNQGNVCFDDYTKCLISQDNPTPVCGYNSDQPREEFQGFRSFQSYCDTFFDNCRRGYRHWRIIDTGKCDYDKMVKESFRRWWNKGLHNVKKFVHFS